MSFTFDFPNSINPDYKTPVAYLNGCVNVFIPDGWYPEFVRDGVNGFVIPNTEVTDHKFQQDETDAHNTYALLEKVVIPLYYDQSAQWIFVTRKSMRDISPAFGSNRLAREYYERLYVRTQE